MTHSKIEKPNVDIYSCPKGEISNATQLSIGDLHANAMLLMYFLVSNGIVKISDEKYGQLKNIYIKDKLTKSDISEFDKIIDELEIGEKPLIRLIGDEICDRGQNDYFMFKIFNKLKKSDVKFEALLSNHGIEFLIPYEKKQELYAPNIGFMGQSRSLDNMRTLIQDGVITREEVDALISDSYLPNLKLISYSLHGNNITIYSHAGIGLETIQSLAEKFKDDGVVYKDDTVENLAKTIEAVNAVFAKHVKAGTVHTLTVDIAKQDDFKGDPVTFLIWNRSYRNLSRAKEHHGYNVYYVHGHDSGEPSKDNIFNLDNALAKGITANKGTFLALGTQGGPLHQLDGIAFEELDGGESVKSDRIEEASESSTLQNAHVDIPSSFHSQLAKLEAKADLLRMDGHTDAYTSAMSIHSSLKNAYNQLEQDNDHAQFNKTCTEAINQGRPVLDKHRGWSEFLINLAIGLPTVGIGLLIKGVINVAQNKSFFFVHKTISSEIVDNLKESINQTPGNNKL